MKKILLFIVVWGMWGMRIYSQEVFPKSDAIWNVRMPVEIADRYAVLLGLMGDTLINDTVYQKLYLLNDTLLRPESIEHYMGAIRQENQQVWFRVDSVRTFGEKYVSYEFLLCDFSLKKGDSFTYGNIFFTAFTCMNFPAILYENAEYYELISCPFASVDSVIIDDKGRRHLFINYWCYYQDEWIEGVGNLKGLFMQFFYPSMAYMKEEDRSVLQCMKYKDEVRYRIEEKWSSCDKCFCMSQFVVEIREEVKGDIRLFVPDSNKKCIRVEVPQEDLPCQVELYNASGVSVSIHKIDEKVSTLYFETLSEGTYIYRISRYGKAMQRGKIMIN